MEKRLKEQSVIKAIIAMLVVIIAVSAILVYVVLNGEVTSIKDIQEHPNRYINQTVNIQGTYRPTDFITTDFSVLKGTDKSGGTIYLEISMRVKEPVPFNQNSEYKFTGIVRYTKSGLYVDTGGLYLEVTKIETT